VLVFRFLDPRGRANFGEFFTVSLICLVLATPLLAVVEAQAAQTPTVVSLIGLWALMIVVWIAGIRRLHDGGDSGAFAALILSGPTILLLGITLWQTDVPMPRWLVLLGAIPLIATGWMWVAFLQVRESPGANRFGPKPRRFAERALKLAADSISPVPRWPLVDPRGRTSRFGYLAGLGVCITLAVPLIAARNALERASVWYLAVAWAAFVLAAALLLLLGARRSNDLDRAQSASRQGSGAQFGLLVSLGPLLCAPVMLGMRLSAIPTLLVGGILSLGLLFMAMIDGHHGPNRHGPDPVRGRPPVKRRTAHTEDFLKIRRRMRREAQPTLLLGEAASPAFSKLGGDPELPAGTAWPSNERGPLSFLAQVDLAQVHAGGGPDWLPQTGALYVFAEADGGGGDGRAAVVLHVGELSKAQATPPPPGLPTFGARFEERRVSLQTFTSLPSLDSLGVDVRELDVEDDELDELSDLPMAEFPEVPLHRLGGHPNEIQESRMALECELGSRGLDTGTILEGEVDPKLLRASKSWRLLFQIDSDPGIEMMWGDTGMLYIFVREADARAGDFSKTWLISQSH
jgi:uncharacterized protein YwqG/uncharacterized membrane protein YhaH (DUF805 family)